MFRAHFVQAEAYACTGCHKFLHRRFAVAGDFQKFLADKSGDGTAFVAGETVVENTYFQRILNEFLYDIIYRHKVVIGLQVFRFSDDAEHKTHPSYVRFNNKRVAVALRQYLFNFHIGLASLYKTAFRVTSGWQVFIDGHLGHSFKPAKGQFRVGRGKKPERPGTHAVPGPYRDYRDVFDSPVPAFPVAYFVEDVVQLHKLFGNPDAQPIRIGKGTRLGGLIYDFCSNLWGVFISISLSIQPLRTHLSLVPLQNPLLKEL